MAPAWLNALLVWKSRMRYEAIAVYIVAAKDTPIYNATTCKALYSRSRRAWERGDVIISVTLICHYHWRHEGHSQDLGLLTQLHIRSNTKIVVCQQLQLSHEIIFTSHKFFWHFAVTVDLNRVFGSPYGRLVAAGCVFISCFIAEIQSSSNWSRAPPDPHPLNLMRWSYPNFQVTSTHVVCNWSTYHL